MNRGYLRFGYIKMEDSDSSLAWLGLDGEDLMCVDPVAAAQALHHSINELIDGEVAVSVLRLGLNIRSDARVLRDRLERHQMRRYFGSGAAPWNPVIDERFKIREPRLISSSPLDSSNLIGNFPQARVFEIPTSTGIFRPDVLAISDLALERRGSSVAIDEISDRSKLNHQPHAQSTRCLLRFLHATGSNCCSQRSMDLTRVVSVPISVPSCSTAESAPIHASPTHCSTLFSPMPASSLEAVRVVKISIENSNAVPAVGSNPSLSRSCSRISGVREDRIIQLSTKLSPSVLSSGGFVSRLDIANQSEVLSYRTDMDSEGLMLIKQRLDSWIEVNGCYLS